MIESAIELPNTVNGLIDRVRVLHRSRAAYAASLITIVAITVLFIWSTYQLIAVTDDYRSDEVWYISSSRNILRVLFNTELTYERDGYRTYTVFADSPSTIHEVKSLVLEKGGTIVRYYNKVTAIAIGVKDTGIIEEIKSMEGVIDVVSGYPYPDAAGINRYMNLEHPPLGKYVFGLSMALCGDKPVCWRLPSLVSGTIVLLTTSLLALRLFGPLGGGIVSVIAYTDPLLKSMSSVGMLDIFLALFTSLGLLLLSYRKVTLTIILFSLAVCTKFSAVFLLVGILIYLWRKEGLSRALIKILIILSAVAIAIYLPYLLKFGTVAMLTEFIGALKWHTTSRPGGPTTSSPIDWVLGMNSFYISVDPTIVAMGGPWIYVPAFICILLLLPSYSRLYAYKIEEEMKLIVLIGALFFAQYLLIMIMGNRTLYSFYFVSFAPIGYILFVKFLDIMFIRGRQLDDSLSLYVQYVRLAVKGDMSWIPIPKEIKLLVPDSYLNPRFKRAATLVVLVLLFSLFMHIDAGQIFRLYADTGYVIRALGPEDAGRLLGVQGLLILLLRHFKASPNHLAILDIFFMFIALNELFILTRRELSKRKIKPLILAYPMLLSLLLYTGYDGSAVSFFLFVLSLNLLLEGRDVAGAAVLGLSAGNPMMLLMNLMIVLTLSYKEFTAFLLTSSFSILITPLLMNTSIEAHIGSLISYYTTQKTATFYALFPTPYTFTVGTMLTLILAGYLITKYMNVDFDYKAATIILTFMAVYPNMLPQWCLTLLAASVFISKKHLGKAALFDLFNALIIATWFSNDYIMEIMFKYKPVSPIEGITLPNISSLLRAFASITILMSFLSELEAREAGDYRKTGDR